MEYDRCRVMLGAGPGICDVLALCDALSGGDVASVILFNRPGDDPGFSAYCNLAVPEIQKAGVAALVAVDTQVMGRSGADGVYADFHGSNFADLIARFSPQKIVGCGGMLDRDTALRAGELNPDFVLFGKPGRDIKPEPHPKNIRLAAWWSEFVEVPGIVLGGNSVECVKAVSETGIDFVLLEAAVFGSARAPGECVAEANAILDAHAPKFSELEA